MHYFKQVVRSYDDSEDLNAPEALRLAPVDSRRQVNL